MQLKKILSLLFVFFNFICFPLFAETMSTDVPLTKNPTTWPRADVQTFGCFLEKELAYRDPKFNCSLKNYHKQINPSKAETYYEGPPFPDSKVQQIHPAIQGIVLSWEHGSLQGVALDFKPGISPSQIVEFFHLPKKGSFVLPNLMSYDIQSSTPTSYSLLLQGFDHQGTGD